MASSKSSRPKEAVVIIGILPMHDQRLPFPVARSELLLRNRRNQGRQREFLQETACHRESLLYVPAGADDRHLLIWSEARLNFVLASVERLLKPKSVELSTLLAFRVSASVRHLAPSGNELVQLQLADPFDQTALDLRLHLIERRCPVEPRQRCPEQLLGEERPQDFVSGMPAGRRKEKDAEMNGRAQSALAMVPVAAWARITNPRARAPRRRTARFPAATVSAYSAAGFDTGGPKICQRLVPSTCKMTRSSGS